MAEKSHKRPLVSVVVITYNSALFVEETLKSIYDQTYVNLELIISDDASKDNTIGLCTDWLDNFGKRFVNTELVTVSKNSGIPSNCNRGFDKAKGEWIKYIAADDALFPDAIEKVIKTASKWPKISLMLTQIEIFSESFEKKNSRGITLQNWRTNPIYLDESKPKSQIEFLLNGNYFSAPGYFMKRSLFIKVDGFDNRFPLIEDVPFVFRALFVNEKIFFRPILTTKYRKHSNNLTANIGTILPKYFSQTMTVLYNASVKYGKLNYIIDSLWNRMFTDLIFTLGNSGKVCFYINRFRLYFRPMRFYRFFSN